jgi:predicted Holliday junction resolvase-like endonuclease
MISGVVLTIMVAMGFFILWCINTIRNLQRLVVIKTDENAKVISHRKSSEVRIGNISENLAPFLAGFNHDPKKSHFLGMPVDFIIFEDENIVFLEVKSGSAQLSQTQKKIKQLVLDKKITWEEFRVSGEPKEINEVPQNKEQNV